MSKKNKPTASERHCIMKTAKLNQPIDFNDVLTSECKSENMLHWGTGFTFVTIGNKNFEFLQN